MNLFTKQTKIHRLLREKKIVVTRGEGWEGGIVRKLGIDMYTLLMNSSAAPPVHLVGCARS